MNLLQRLLLCACLLAPGFAPASAASSTGPRLTSVQAEFTQEKHLKILARPLLSQGVFVFQAPQSLRWEYRTPLRSLLLMHEGKLQKLVDRGGQLVPDQGAGVDSMRLVLENIGNWIDGRFTANPLFEVTRTAERTLLLQPKEAGLRAVISQIELVLGAEEGIVERVTIFEGPDNFTRLTFHHATLNRDIPRDTFTSP